jgi:hypothetical protein
MVIKLNIMRQTRYVPCNEGIIAYKILIKQYECRWNFRGLVVIGTDSTFTLMFKKCGVKCRCVVAGNVSQVLFCFIFILCLFYVFWRLHAALYETVLG